MRWLRAALRAGLVIVPVVLGLVIASQPCTDEAAPVYTRGVKVDCIETEEERELLEKLGIQALDDAFRNQVEHLYAIWMKDPHGQPARAQHGMTQAIYAWLAARKAMGSFRPPGCHS